MANSQTVEAWNKVLISFIAWLTISAIDRSSHPEVFCEKNIFKNFAKFTRRKQLHTCEIFKNTYFYRTSPVAASERNSN